MLYFVGIYTVICRRNMLLHFCWSYLSLTQRCPWTAFSLVSALSGTATSHEKNANIENITLNLLLPIRIFFFLSQQIHFGNKTRGTTDYVLFTEI